MDEPRRLALQDIENNFETDTRIVELDFRDSRFLKELQDRGYKNIAGTGDVENFINFEVFLPSETHKIFDAEVVCCFSRRFPDPCNIPGKVFYGSIAKVWDDNTPLRVAEMLAEADYKEIKVRTTSYSKEDFKIPPLLGVLMSSFLTLIGIDGPKYVIKASRV